MKNVKIATSNTRCSDVQIVKFWSSQFKTLQGFTIFVALMKVMSTFLHD